MEPLSLSFIISSFIAGLLTFLAPCTLPLVPGYLAFISGQSGSQESDISDKAIFKNGLAFVLGFSVIFILLGIAAGLAGGLIAEYRLWLTRIGGVFVILFGLFMLGVFRLPQLKRDHRLPIPSWLEIGKPTSSVIIGAAFAFGWTPCVGPILGSILLLASTQATALTGGFLLLVFSIGLAIPFLLIATSLSKGQHLIAKYQNLLKGVSIVGGIFLILLGLLLITDNFGLLIEYGYDALDFINYEGLLNHL